MRGPYTLVNCSCGAQFKIPVNLKKDSYCPGCKWRYATAPKPKKKP